MTQPMPTVATFEAWLEKAKAPDRYSYHFGQHLMPTRLNYAVRAAYNRGDITLTQRRIDHNQNGGEFEFIAIKLQHRGKISMHSILPIESARVI